MEEKEKKGSKSSKDKVVALSTKEEKDKALENAIAQIEKQYGKGSIMKLTDKAFNDIEVISTGCISIDLALGVGGVPRGRIVEIYGPESSGKTTLSLHIVAEAQRNNGNVAFIDAEHALDPAYANKLGIDLSRLYISQPDNGEQALDITESLVRSGAMDVIVIDSVAALTPKVEIDGEMGDARIGAHARLMSQALRKLTAVAAKSKTCIIFINQMREKVGVVFGNPEVTTGGKALKFYASMRLDVRKGEPIKDGVNIVGNKTKVKVVKNKLSPPFKTAQFDILYGKGISREGDLIELAVEFGIFTKTGAWFGRDGERLCQGKEKLRDMLIENKEMASEVEAKIRKMAAEKGGDFLTADDNDSDDGGSDE